MSSDRKPHTHAAIWLAIIACSSLANALTIQDHLMAKGFKSGRGAGASVDTIVLHFSSDVGADEKNPYDVDSVIKLYADYNSSAHYLIGREGKIYRLVKETDTANHAGKGVWGNRTNTLNNYSIGIGTFEEMHAMLQDKMTQADYDSIPKKHLGFTDAQYSALKELIADIRSRHPNIKNDRQHIIGHHQYAPSRRPDPGDLFRWDKIGL